MKSEYFGIIKDKGFINWGATDQENYLVENKLFQKKGVLNLNWEPDNLIIGQIKGGGETRNIVEVCKPVQKILIDFYDFLIEIYKGGLKGPSFNFFNDFDKQTFGKSKSFKYDFASNQFRNIFELICPKEYWYFIKDNNAHGVIRLGSVFKSLKQKREMDILNLEKERDLILQFLIGNRNFFNRELFETNKTIIDIIDFEANLITLLVLNKEYQFEKDDYFSPKLKSDILFEVFDSKLDDEVVRFIDKCLDEIKNKHHSYIVALHRCLIDFELMNGVTELEFRNGINNTYGLNLSRLKVSESAAKNHHDRLKNYKEKWLTFSKSDS